MIWYGFIDMLHSFRRLSGKVVQLFYHAVHGTRLRDYLIQGRFHNCKYMERSFETFKLILTISVHCHAELLGVSNLSNLFDTSATYVRMVTTQLKKADKHSRQT